MADAIIGSTVNLLLSQLVSGISENINLIFGFKKELDRLKNEVEIIRSVLRDAERRMAMNDEAVKLWLKRLEELAQRAVDLLEEFAYEAIRRKVKKVSPFLPSSIIFERKMAKKIKKIFASLEIINKQASDYGLQRGDHDINYMAPPHALLDRETDSFVNLPDVVGREDDASKIVELLVRQSNLQALSVLSIVGMGGIGKTTLAKHIYNDKHIEECFNWRIWVCVSDDFDVKRILKEMLESLKKEKYNVDTMNAMLEGLQKELAGEKYLLVLDDVWNEDHKKWDDLISRLTSVNTSKGSNIVVTTRKFRVASIVETIGNPYSLKRLSDDECWSIFSAKAFANGGVPLGGDFEAIGRQIVKKCGGLPLAAKLAGSMMRSKKEKIEWLSIANSEVWDSNENESGLLPILKLSYDNLPSPSLKQCFRYCSIFTKDSVMSKKTLIPFWMALGYLQPNEGDNMDMEDIGNKYFNILLQSSLFEDIETDFYGHVRSCKMHDTVHDLAQSISKSDVFNYETSTRLARDEIPHVRHLALYSDEVKFNIIRREGAYRLHTLLLKDIIVGGGIADFKFLRILKLNRCDDIQKLSTSIKELIHLKYLDLSEIVGSDFPDSITKLYYLQTLSLGHVRYLPKDLRNMLSLRHLYFYSSDNINMPIKIGRLTHLHTLPLFVVGEEKGRQIEELGSLENLSGKLEITCLEKVKSKEDAESAKLCEKLKIYKLEFVWSTNARKGNSNIDKDVIEGLQPHPYLKVLEVHGFGGDNFPLWVMNMAVNVRGSQLLLDNLVELQLVSCDKVEGIPMLGQLPLLRGLILNSLVRIKYIGETFYGYNSDASSSSSRPITLFPSLKQLDLTDLLNLEEWTETNPEVVVFPCLENLNLFRCWKFKTAPSNFPCLKKLEIQGVNSGLPVISLCKKLTTLTSLFIGSVSDLISLPDSLFLNNRHRLKNLSVWDCGNLKSIPSLQGLTSLTYLRLYNCEMLERVPESLQSCTSLKNLCLENCNNLRVSIEDDIQAVPSLTSLAIIGCPKVTSLPLCLCSLARLETLKITEVMDCLDGIQQMQWVSLRSLRLIGRLQWDTLPEQIQYLTALRKLDLRSFGVEALPDWFGKLEELEELELNNMEKLQYLPSAEAMLRLTKLRFLHIWCCPLLKARCLEGSKPEQFKISNIADVTILP